MKKYIFSISIIILALLTSQCTQSKNKILEKINNLENEINASFPNPNPLKIKELHKLYIEYANKYNEDTLSPHFIYKAAEAAVNIQEYDKAIDDLDLLINQYPQHKLVPYAIFFKGFIYETFLNNKEEAEKHYKTIIAKYKEHPLTKQAAFAIESLWMNDQEIAKILEIE